MNRADFIHILYFPPEEVEATGADLEDVEYETLRMIDRARGILGVPVHLIVNGMTTGKHKSPEHPKGRAVDFTAPEADPVRVTLAMALVGFHGIGVYRNHRGAYSYHGDRRTTLGVWYGVKDGPKSKRVSKQLEFKE